MYAKPLLNEIKLGFYAYNYDIWHGRQTYSNSSETHEKNYWNNIRLRQVNWMTYFDFWKHFLVLTLGN